MRVRAVLGYFFVLVLSVAPGAVAATATSRTAPPADPRVKWTVQFRAADAIGEAVATLNARTAEQVRGRFTASSASAGPTTRRAQDVYRHVLEIVAAEVATLPARDAELAPLSDRQLIEELAALRSYNLRALARMEELSAIQRQLAPTTRPADATVVADDAVAVLRGRTRDRRWLELRGRMRNAIIARGAAPSRVASQDPLPNGATSYRSVPLADPRWQPYYYGPDDTFGWFRGGNPTDPTDTAAFDFRGGGGVYERTDSRVNRDYDTRTQSQFDRRVNIEADRRLNIHVDPRQNF